MGNVSSWSAHPGCVGGPDSRRAAVLRRFRLGLSGSAVQEASYVNCRAVSHAGPARPVADTAPGCTLPTGAAGGPVDRAA